MMNLIATFGFVGYLRPAPGTWGSLAALPFAWVIVHVGGFQTLMLATMLALLIGWIATTAVTAEGDDHDPSEIVIDEVVGQWIALWPAASLYAAEGGSDTVWIMAAVAFVLFRLFDIRKPGPVGWADRRDDAFGVMMDDVIAGALAAAAIALWLFAITGS